MKYFMINQKTILWQKIETTQYNAALAMTNALKGTSQIKTSQWIRLRTSQIQMVIQKTVFRKIKKTGLSEYLLNMIPQSNHQYKTQSNEDVTTMYYKTGVFRYYFLFTILEWNKLDMQIRKSKSSLSFKNSLAEISQPKSKSAYKIYNPIVLEFLIELWLGLNHLNEHKIKHNLQDSLKIEDWIPFSFLSALSSFHKYMWNPLR